MVGTAMRVIIRVDYSIASVLEDCGNNKGLLDLEVIKDTVNVDELLDLESFGIKARIDELSQTAVNLSDVDIMSEDLEQQLNNLANAELDNINFDSFEQELNKSFTTDDLMTLAAAVRSLADTLPDGASKTDLNGDADTLEEIHNTTVSDMKKEAAALQVALQTLETDVKGGEKSSGFKEYTEGVIVALQQAEDDIHVNGTKIIQDFITTLANGTYTDFENYVAELTATLKSDVGQCKPVSDVITSTLDIFCVDVLQPYNGFWFALGWFLFFSTLAMIFGFVLIGLYHKTEEYDRYHGKNFDDPRHPQPSNGGRYGNGYPNGGYDNQPNDYTQSSRAPHYQYQNGAAGQGGGAYYPPTAPPQNPPHYYNNRHY